SRSIYRRTCSGLYELVHASGRKIAHRYRRELRLRPRQAQQIHCGRRARSGKIKLGWYGQASWGTRFDSPGMARLEDLAQTCSLSENRKLIIIVHKRMRLLTTSEAAEYLRLKERKVYELIAEEAIPCTKVTGKWLFPQDELDHWLTMNLLRPKDLPPREPMPIVAGSHDPLLEWSLRESGSGLASLAEGSEAGLARFADGGLVACAVHFHTLEDDGDPNVERLQRHSAF